MKCKYCNRLFHKHNNPGEYEGNTWICNDHRKRLNPEGIYDNKEEVKLEEIHFPNE
jgi:hypothetical protein